MKIKLKKVAIIVAHPDDETLWAGGTILSHPNWKCFILCLSRKNDIERASNFYKALKYYKAKGVMADLYDGPNQIPIENYDVENEILQLLPRQYFDLIITHNLTGEYTKHLRHEEVSKAVLSLWQSREIYSKELWTFAYEDGCKQYNPKAVETATLFNLLPKKIWDKKYKIITKIFGFKKDSWEAKTTPKEESFWQFTNTDQVAQWISKGGIL